eukprot:3107410-Amphidinium_carterae.1
MMYMEGPATIPKRQNNTTTVGVEAKRTYVIHLIYMFYISITFFRMLAEHLHHELRKTLLDVLRGVQQQAER